MENKYIGSDFEDFLKEEDIYEEVKDIAIKKVIAYQLAQEMKAQNITKTKVNRLLNPDNSLVTI